MASDDARRTALPDLKRPSLTKWLSDEILHRLPPFLESSWQHVDPQMPYVGPAHSHLSSPCPATLSFRSAIKWILAAATAAVASMISRPVVPSARTDVASAVDGVSSLLHGGRRSHSHDFKGEEGMQGQHQGDCV